MWGYSIAAASLGIKHKLVGDFQVEPRALTLTLTLALAPTPTPTPTPTLSPNQVEPGALSDAAQLRSFNSRYYIFHYTYQFEYMMDGTPC